MIAVDTNLLVYAHREDADLHRPALDCLTGLATGGGRWAIPWPCLHEFLAVVTHPRIYAPPTPMETALRAMRVWGESPGCELIGEGPDYLAILGRLLHASRCTGPMVHDARIAAICLHHGVKELWSCDRDFSRFSELRVRNPL